MADAIPPQSFAPNDPLIKICGITRLEDGLAALSAGADWLGFIRWSGSKRFRPLADCAALLKELRRLAPSPFQAVAVYVDQPRDLILDEIRSAGFDRAQLHGNESSEFAASLPVPVIKTIKMRPDEFERDAARYPGLDLLIDTDVPGLPGGTGQSYDAGVLTDLTSRRRLIVAGGLNPANVADIVARIRPYGVDVSSGVEVEPGIKDGEKIRRFVAAVRAAKLPV
jgi:phosphoribosylanthranilate isomerase